MAYLKADGHTADAYVSKALGGIDEIYVSYTIYVPDALLIEATAHTFTPFFHALIDNTTPGDDFEMVDLKDSGSGAQWNVEVAGLIAGVVVAGSHAVQVHAKISTATLVYVIDGATHDLSAPTIYSALNINQFDELRVGAVFSLAHPADITYITNVAVGTTAFGSSDILADDFSGGTFAAWTSHTGAVSVTSGVSGQTGVSVAFGDLPFAATPTWVRLDDPAGTNVVTGYTVRRGRAYMLDETDTGTASVGFVDTAGKVDPTNSSGPFYPMNPNAPVTICLRNPVTGQWVPLFWGMVQQVPQTFDPTAKVSTGKIECADMFAILAKTEVPPGIDYADDGTPLDNTDGDTRYASQAIDDHIRAILADGAIPPALTRIFSGNVTTQAVVYPAGTTILQALYDAANAEFPGVANIYVDKTGLFTFHGRFARFNPTAYSAQTWDCGDMTYVNANPGAAPLQTITFDRDINKILNAVLFSPQGIADADIAGQLVADVTSIDDYGQSGDTASNLLTNHGQSDGFTDLEETKKFAQYYVDNFKDPQNHCTQVTFRWLPPSDPNAPALWDLLCNIEIGDLVNITTTHPGDGGFEALPHFVEGLSYTVGIGPRYAGQTEGVADVTLTVDLSPQAYFETAPEGWN